MLALESKRAVAIQVFRGMLLVSRKSTRRHRRGDMRTQLRLLTAVSLLILACPSPAAADDIVDAINPTATPNGGTYNT